MKEFDFKYELRLSARRKTLAITVHPDNRIVVHAPAACPSAKIARFVEEKSDWVKGALEANLRRGRQVGEKGLEAGDALLYLGGEYTLRVEQASSPAVVLEDGQIIVRLSADGARLGDSAVKERLRQWYVSQALAEIKKRMPLYAARIGVSPGRVTIKSMRSRWGSCSTTGRISLAWNIIMAPVEIVDYLIVHELCHLVHHDHSEQYWSLVGAILPDHRDRRKWLRENGVRLRL